MHEHATRSFTACCSTFRFGHLALALTWLVAAGCSPPAPAVAGDRKVQTSVAALGAPSAVAERSPNTSWSGRLQAITVDPNAPNTIIAGSDNGGMWRTTNQTTWTQVVFPTSEVRDVRYAPGRSDIVLATAPVDSRVRVQSGGALENGGGIWISTDGGLNFRRPTTQPPVCVAGQPMNAYGIAYDSTVTNRVYVGTDCGVAISNDRGENFSTFTTLNALVRVDGISLVARGGTVDVHTTDPNFPHYRSTNSGGNFTPRCTDTAPADGKCDSGITATGGGGNHTIARSPNEDVLFLTSFDPTKSVAQLWESDNQGQSWTNLNSPGTANRPPFVFTYNDASNRATVMFGDGTIIHRQTCANAMGLRCTATAVSWSDINLSGAHVDPSDLAFHPTSRCPLYVAQDGGAGVSSDCGATWSMIGTGANGIRALEVYEMAGQVHPGMPVGNTDLYLATQDNGLWASITSGGSWPRTVGAEGVALSVPRSSPTRTNVIVSFVGCGNCQRFSADAGFLSGTLTPWPDPPNFACPDVDENGACDACVNRQVINFLGVPLAICNAPVRPKTCTVEADCPGVSVCLRALPADPTGICGTDLIINSSGAPGADGQYDGCAQNSDCVGAGGACVLQPPATVPMGATPRGRCGVDRLNNSTGVLTPDNWLDGPLLCLDQDNNAVCDGRACIDRLLRGAVPPSIQSDHRADQVCDPRPLHLPGNAPRAIAQGVYVQFDDGGISTHRNTTATAGTLGGSCAAVPCGAGLLCSQNVCANVFPYTFWRTTNATATTATWTSTGITIGANQPTTVLTGNGQIAGPAANPNLFQPILMDINGSPASAEPTFIELKNVLAGTTLKVHSAQFPNQLASGLGFLGQIRALGVNPNNANQIFAINGTPSGGDAFITTDGGTNWTLLPQVEKLINAGALGGPTPTAEYLPWGFGEAQATTAAYDPANANRILIGTQDSGIVGTLDGGTTWARLCGSEVIPRITSFFFDNVDNKVYASSYGRGIWEVFPSNQQKPRFTTAPANVPNAPDCGAVAVGTPVAIDDCEGLAVTISNDKCGTTASPCGNFGRGPTTVKWTAEDAAGNTTTANSTVTVVDTTPPTSVTAPPPIVLSSNTGVTMAQLDPGGLRFANDGCIGTIGIQWRTNPAIPPGNLPFGASDVQWFARDDLNNENPVPAVQKVLVLGGEGEIAGDSFTCELSATGDVTCFGAAASGRLGDGTYIDRWAPGRVTLSNAAQLSVGRSHACAVKRDGTVWCWGENNDGRLGTGLTFFDSNVPMQVVGLTDVKQVSAGPMHSCAVTNSGQLWCWGENNDGRLGVFGLFLDQLVPVRVTALNNVRQVSAGEAHTCAVLNNGDLYCWGENNDGRLGLGNAPLDVLVPTRVTAISNVKQVSAGSAHSCAVLQTGALYCWGEDADGRLGIGPTLFDRDSPVLVSTLTGVVQVAAGVAHTCAVHGTGQVSCWGENSEGRLGIGPTAVDAVVPTAVPGVVTAVQVSTGTAHSCAVLRNADRVCWGDNLFGQLGDGSGVDRPSSTESAGLCDVTSVEIGKDFGCAVGVDEGFTTSAYCWGWNGSGQLGVGDLGPRRAPWSWAFPTPTLVTNVSAGDDHACATAAFGGLFCWGLNTDGRVGDGSLVSRLAPTQVFTNPPPAPSTSCNYREANGRAYQFCTNPLIWTLARDACRGSGMELVRIDDQVENDFLELYVSGSLWTGGNDRQFEATWRWTAPGTDNGDQFWSGGSVLVGGTPVRYANWIAPFEPSINDCARIDTTGGWSALGCDQPAGYVCEGAGTTFQEAAKASAGATHSCAIMFSGGIKCWGSNTLGKLGDGTTTARTKPTSVVSLPIGFTALEVGAGDRHTCALLTNGTNTNVFCWGDGASGRLGRGSNLSSSLPVQVLGLPATGLTRLSVGGAHSCAATAAGATFCWGEGDFGRLGQGNQLDCNQAGQVLRSGAVLTTTALSAGKEHTCAVQSAGTVLCWGRNLGGQLGDNTIFDRLAPVQVSGLTTAQDVSAGLDHSCAVRLDGTERVLSCWGNNAQGELGTGTLVSTAVPVAVGGSSCQVF